MGARHNGCHSPDHVIRLVAEGRDAGRADQGDSRDEQTVLDDGRASSIFPKLLKHCYSPNVYVGLDHEAERWLCRSALRINLDNAELRT